MTSCSIYTIMSKQSIHRQCKSQVKTYNQYQSTITHYKLTSVQNFYTTGTVVFIANQPQHLCAIEYVYHNIVLTDDDMY